MLGLILSVDPCGVSTRHKIRESAGFIPLLVKSEPLDQNRTYHTGEVRAGFGKHCDDAVEIVDVDYKRSRSRPGRTDLGFE